MISLRDVELVEFHDAVVDRIEIRKNGETVVGFSHLPIYRRETPTTLGVWSSRAELRFQNVESCKADGVIPQDDADALDRADVRRADASLVEAAALITGASFDVATAELTWLSGRATFTVYGGAVSLVLLHLGERFETWTDDLSAP